MEDEKKPIKSKDKSAKGVGKKLWSLLLELVGELFITGLFLAIGAGTFALFGKEHLVSQIDMDTLILLGVFVIFAVVYVIAVIVNCVKKKKNK